MHRDGTDELRDRLTAACLAAAILLLASGCGRAVTVTPPDPAPADASVCRMLHDRLPERLAGQARLAVTPDDGTTAAWGTPAIVWRCGVGVPGALTPTSQLLTVDGVDWLPEELTEGVRFTTVRSSPATELTVPDDYRSAASLLTALPTGAAPSGAIAHASPVR